LFVFFSLNKFLDVVLYSYSSRILFKDFYNALGLNLSIFFFEKFKEGESFLFYRRRGKVYKFVKRHKRRKFFHRYYGIREKIANLNFGLNTLPIFESGEDQAVEKQEIEEDQRYKVNWKSANYVKYKRGRELVFLRKNSTSNDWFIDDLENKVIIRTHRFYKRVTKKITR